MSAPGPARLVLASAFVVLLFNSGARFSIGLLLPSMAADLGWSRSTLSLAVTVFMIVTAIALPFVGRLVDRYGAPGVLAISVVISAASIAAMGLVRTPAQALVLYGVVFALGSAGTSITPIGVLLRRWYPDRVGMANSIAISGMGLGQLVIIAALSAQLVTLGWRGAFVSVGVAMAVIVLPLVLLAGRLSLPDAVGPDRTLSTTPDHGATSLAAVFRARGWVLLLAIYLICGFQDFLVATHIVAFAIDEGVSHALAGHMLALMGLAGLAGVLLAGLLNDRFGPGLPTLLCFVIRVAVFGVLLVDRSQTAVIGSALLYGATFWITAPLTVVFARQLCGAVLLGTVSGLITMSHHAAGGAGAWFAARVFDTRGNYDLAFEWMLAASLVATCMALGLLRAPRTPD